MAMAAADRFTYDCHVKLWRKDWTPQEDALLEQLVEHHGTKMWVQLAKILKKRNGKQCRRRWKSLQNAELTESGITWSREEDAALMAAQQKHGNKWAEIARMIGGRTDNAAKNRWAVLNKRQPRQIQPVSSSISSASGATCHTADPSPASDTASTCDTETTMKVTDSVATQADDNNTASASAAAIQANDSTPAASPAAAQANARPCTKPLSQATDCPSIKVEPSIFKSDDLTASGQQAMLSMHSAGHKAQAPLHTTTASASAAAMQVGPSSRRLAYLTSLRSINSRNSIVTHTTHAQAATATATAPLQLTVSLENTRPPPAASTMPLGSGQFYQMPVVQIQSFCPAYQARPAAPGQASLPVKAQVPSAAANAGQESQLGRESALQEQEQDPDMQQLTGCAHVALDAGQSVSDKLVAGPVRCTRMPQGSAEVPHSRSEMPHEAAATIITSSELQGQSKAVHQDCAQVAHGAMASITADSATCMAYLAGVLDEQRRGKDPSVQAHIDKAWMQLQMLLTGPRLKKRCISPDESSILGSGQQPHQPQGRAESHKHLPLPGESSSAGPPDSCRTRAERSQQLHCKRIKLDREQRPDAYVIDLS